MGFLVWAKASRPRGFRHSRFGLEWVELGSGSKVRTSGRTSSSLPGYSKKFGDLSLSLLGNAVFDIRFPPFPFVPESPLLLIPFVVFFLARKGPRLPDLRGFKNLMFYLPSSTVYDV